jgi:hypothetical protein
MVHMRLYGSERDEELIGYLCVGQALTDEFVYLALTSRKR